MDSNTSSSPPSLQKRSARIHPIFSITLLKRRKFSVSLLLLCSFISVSLFANPCASDVVYSSQIVYSTYCNHVVPDSPLESPTFLGGLTAQNLRLQSAFFSGGSEILGKVSQFNSGQPNYVMFNAHNARKTLQNGTYAIRGNLLFQTPHNAVYRPSDHSKVFQVRGPRFPVRRGVANFKLNGYWSQSTGKLCMVGSGSSYKNAKTGNLGFFNVVLKLDYPVNSSAFDSLVKGVLESVDDKSSGTYFEPISILGMSKILSYEYRLIEKGNECLSGNDEGENLPLSAASRGLCRLLSQTSHKFELDYGSNCHHETCDVLGVAGKYMPNVMFFKGIRCIENKKMQMLLGFRNSSTVTYSSRFPFDPHTTLVAEGSWDQKKNRLCAVACRIMNITESLTGAFVGNCSTKLSLRFPAVLSLRNQSTMLGQIYIDTTEDGMGYYGKITFRSFWGDPVALPGVNYEYTEIDNVGKSCSHKTSESRGETYPNGYSLDMRFDMSVTDSKGKLSRGYASPLFVGDQLSYANLLYGPGINHIEPPLRSNENYQNLLKISYRLSFKPASFMSNHYTSLSEAVHISAEGIYDRSIGVLCMRGCRRLRSNDLKLMKNDSMDCGVVINVHFPPLNAKGGESVKGTIMSTRNKSDPMYFERLELSSNSIYTTQAKESIWRMDLEITMVLISNTLACVFVGLQLFYMKKYPDVLPFISVVMLLILTLGYMIPLILNFEALFLANPNHQNVFPGGGGWLEVNEIMVRVVTMIAFLLQFRLLQLTWSARQSNDSQKGLWKYEKKVLYVSLPLYILGGLVALYIYYMKNSHRSPFLLHHDAIPPQRNVYQIYTQRHLYQQHSLWDGLKSYGGLVLDSFLLPQILFNLFLDSREMALAASFYSGTTLVRLLPHAYDLYRAHISSWVFELSDIYADHKVDFYSTSWNIVIPCVGLLFAMLIFLQQRFGGRCILPKRFRERASYEMVPVVSGVELQGEQIQKNFFTL
ncbi:hypothetical protein HS088_TW21G01062 [Tripterygium wilfordii]|uniref:RING-type E3 ubiquitin transferase n=1 Tax=Tripterygium wilfordii TaxID=458696 RepID=A0A7J7C479_TRIWF|nr:uncharacterized protein LOC119989379 [Tripterygium wilfordii]KAF5728908.1 hypothetical protein HS088_TW21G01062 [Tripterygium wilfordii]